MTGAEAGEFALARRPAGIDPDIFRRAVHARGGIYRRRRPIHETGFTIGRLVNGLVLVFAVIALLVALNMVLRAGYALAGWGQPGLPAGSLGYVNLIALAALIPLTMLVAPVGARVAHIIAHLVLSYAFAA